MTAAVAVTSNLPWTHPASSPAAFGMFVYGHQPTPFHWRWLSKAVDPALLRLAVIAPRDSAKTTWIVNALLAWQIGNNPLSTNFIGSVSDTQATERQKAIKLLIESNAQWQEAFPHIKPDYRRGWSEHGLHVWDDRYSYPQWIKMVARWGNPNTPTLTAGGVGSSIVIGKRLTGIVVLDDLHDDKNSQTPLQRDRVWSWVMQTVINTTTEHTKVIAIGTRWQRDDTLGRLKVNPEWHIDEMKAIDDQGRSYWPSRWPLWRLLQRKREIGSAYFRAQYDNDPTGLAGLVFDTAWFQFLPLTLPAFTWVGLGVDLAISEKQTADYTAVCTAALDANNRLYLLDMRRGQWTMNQTLEQLKAAAARTQAQYGRLDLIAIENVQFQAAVTQEMLRTTKLPARGVFPDKDKVARARAWGVRAEQAQVFVDREAPWWPAFADEAADFPTGDHDDQVDAVSAAWQGAGLSAELRSFQTEWPT